MAIISIQGLTNKFKYQLKEHQAQECREEKKCFYLTKRVIVTFAIVFAGPEMEAKQ